MKTSLARPQAVLTRRAAFTLIELLAVMAIILVLAGLILNIAGSAQYNSAKSRATSEIAAMSNALESYKSDNGAYPTDSSTTEVLDAKNVQAYHDPATYIKASQFLYQVLAGFPPTSSSSSNSGSGTPTATPTAAKVYMNFRPDQIHPINASDVVSVHSASMYLIDPFGFSYGYSTIYAATTAANQASASTTGTATTPQPVTTGYNPTFDLWSTAGYAGGGKSTPTGMPGASDAANYSTLWIKNW